MKVDSALNEPLNARVALISVQPEEIDNIKVRLAGPDVFARAGIPRPFFLSKLRFRLMAPEDGDPYIRVTTRESVREPFLNFLLEVVWSRGNMVREFTVLLDPPAYTPPKLARTAARGPAPAETTSAQTASSNAAPSATSYGPIKSTDTLWVIAGKVQADPSVSRNQTMMALLKANPDAFVNGNINQLKRGVVLTVPGLDQVKAITRSQANALVKQQMAEWRQGRAAGKTASRSRPEEAAAPEQAPVSEPEVPVTASIESAPAEKDEVQAESAETGEAGSEEGKEETDKKQLRVLDADGNWVVSDQSDKRYPARESDKIREAIRDSEQELVAVQAINQDILELRAALESKVEALKKALEEKDAQLESLRKQIEQADENATVAVQGSSPAGPSGAPQVTPQAPVTQQAEAPAGNVAASTVVGEPKALSSYWRDEYWMILMGAVIVILSILLLLSMRRRDRVHQLATPELFQVSSEELDAEPRPFTAADTPQIPDTMGDTAQPTRTVTAKYDAVPEDEQNDRRQEGDVASVLTEADIYLAYRRYSQAESLVEEAMQNNPESPELKAKLLEIYAFRRDASSFSRYLDQIYPSLMAQSPDLWEKVVEMGRELVPEHPAFNGGSSGAQSGVKDEADLTVQADDDETLPDDLFDIDLDLPEEQRQDLPSADDESISIEELMDDRPLPDHHEIPSIEIDLDEDDLNLDFDDEDEKPRRKDDE
ncbi:MAG: hypothetical protein OQL28_13030 [Sedimenticola sp.]|nr:hypothetical protein [Sedimenticola sp.]